LFKEVLSGLPDGVMVFDAEGKIAYANPSAGEMLSFDAWEAIGKRFLEAARIAEIDRILQEARQTGSKTEAEVALSLPEEKYVFAEALPVDENNTALFLRDITKVKQLENTRREFVANVSHELKTPLTAIRGYAETLLEGAIENEDTRRDYLQKVIKNTETLSLLINDLLEISSLESGRKEKPLSGVDLKEIMSRAAEMTSKKARAKKIAIVLPDISGGFTVKGDFDHILRAAINLIDNAINYSDPGSGIDILCEKTEDRIKLSVRDRGIGIAREHLPRIFERFYRIDKSRSRDQGGTGLGLSIVKHIMELHGGSVAVESEEGKGSIFTLVFPL
jgi:two-component system phosphate regulon sensor histidine kinase PhoR